MTATVVVSDQGKSIAYSFDDMMKYHGPGSPGGVAHGFKVLERALPLLEPGGPPQRRDLTIHTAFGGPGARDAFELVTRAVTEGRYHLEPALARPERGRASDRFVFRVGLRDRSVTVMVRDGFVSDEFIDLARMEHRSAAEEERLTALKYRMADRVMSRPAIEVYDVVG